MQPGDSITTISERSGHYWKTLWNDPANRELREVRKDPNVLLPGDRLTIPPIRPKTVTAQTGQRHVFLRRGIPARLQVQLLRDGKPRAGEPFVLELAGKSISGSTDPQGRISVHLPSQATEAILRVGPTGNQTTYKLSLRRLQPVTELAGLQERLRNLGYRCEQGVPGPETESAIRLFQSERGLPVTGEPDEETRRQLVVVHGS